MDRKSIHSLTRWNKVKEKLRRNKDSGDVEHKKQAEGWIKIRFEKEKLSFNNAFYGKVTT